MARLYVGTYTQPEDHVDGRGEGIYCFDIDEQTFAVTPRSIWRDITNPSFLALNADATRLYAVSEVADEFGRLFAFAVDEELTLLNDQSTLGAAPCYVAVYDRHVFVANYLGGSVMILPILSGGHLAPASDHKTHIGSSVNELRQKRSHPHAIVLDPEHQYALAPDLGTDRVVPYQYDSTQGRLIPMAAALDVHAGAGPRHLTFSACGQFAYLMNELDSTIMVCSYNDGALTTIQTVAALPKSFTGTPSGADIHVHPSGHFLYASLRDIHCILRMRIDQSSGRLVGKAYAHVLGATPRNFAIDPKGRYLVVANQDSDTLVVMAIDPDTGLLTLAGPPTTVPSPACVAIGP